VSHWDHEPPWCNSHQHSVLLAEQRESHLELVRELDIRSTPTTIFINKDGVEVGRAAGTPKREQVLAALAAIH
jgi:thioredoxin-related protein